MSPFFKRKKTTEERYLEDLERRKREAAGCLEHGEAAFEMTVENVFTVSGRGTVVTGTVAKGRIAKGEQVLIQGRDGSRAVFVDGIEAFQKILESAGEGDIVGLLLRNVKHEQVEPSDVLKGMS